MLPKILTFTGLDERTDLNRVVFLSTRYPLEWGILVGSRLGGNRYPSEKRIQELCELPIQRALHLCCSRSSRVLRGLDWEPEKYQAFTRVQVNALRYEIDQVDDFSCSIDKPVIIQIRGDFPEPRRGVHYLFDKSGGRGIVAKAWPEVPQPSFPSMYGFSGGLGPDNIVEMVNRIHAPEFWIDMESKIRTNNWLDLDKVQEICRLVFG